MIIGIDNGLSGGIVALSPIRGLAPIAKLPIPVTQVWKPARKETPGKWVREVDSRRLIGLLDSIEGNRHEMTVYFEECPFHADRAEVMRSMAMSAGKILAILEAKSFKVVRVLSFDWQPEILGKVPRGMTKEYAAAAVRVLWPDESWRETPRHTKDSDGFIDAALIAEYGRRKVYESEIPQFPLLEVASPKEPLPIKPSQQPLF